MNAKKIVEEVFSRPIAEMIWTSNTYTILPVTPQNFSVGAVLPAVLYMFRWGHRRGNGRFMQEFGTLNEKPKLFYIAGKLTHNNADFVGFNTEVEKSILGDLLLCYALENKGHKEGHREEVQRVFPTHYMSSWIDLPYRLANLRFVPEMIVALLAEQPEERNVRASAQSRRFSVASGLESNLLLKIFGHGVSVSGPLSDMAGDRISESKEYAIDQLLTIRIAQMCKQAPEKIRIKGEGALVQNSWSVAQAAAMNFRDDFSVFLSAYGNAIPRLTLVPMLESLIGIGLLNIFLSCMASAIQWQNTGKLIPKLEQKPWPLFIDASNGADAQLRRLSEESLDGVNRLMDQAQAALMTVRIMDAKGRFDRKLKVSEPEGPDSSEWLDLLGDVRFEKHERSDSILNDLDEKCESLAVALEKEGLNPEVVETLRRSGSATDPVAKLADAMCTLLGDKNQRQKYVQYLDGCLLMDIPHGLGRKRRVSLRRVVDGRSSAEARSIVLSNTVLDALAHRHICVDSDGHAQSPLSFCKFLEVLRERYGFFVDQAPLGHSISNDDLRRNRQTLERRLRDLGLLVGVNDAESMKRLHPRYVTNMGA